MFKNNLRVIVEDNDCIVKLQTETSWAEKDVLYKLLNELIPNKICEIIPLEDRTYEIVWKKREYFLNLLIDDTYIVICKKLNDYFIHFVWF